MLPTATWPPIFPKNSRVSRENDGKGEKQTTRKNLNRRTHRRVRTRIGESLEKKKLLKCLTPKYANEWPYWEMLFFLIIVLTDAWRIKKIFTKTFTTKTLRAESRPTNRERMPTRRFDFVFGFSQRIKMMDSGVMETRSFDWQAGDFRCWKFVFPVVVLFFFFVFFRVFFYKFRNKFLVIIGSLTMKIIVLFSNNEWRAMRTVAKSNGNTRLWPLA